MKKLMRSSLALVALIAGMGLASCGDKTPTEVYDDTKAVTVQWWNNYKQPTSGTEEENRKNSNYREFYYAEDLIKAFQEEHPNITVKQTYKGSYGDIAKAVKEGISTGNVPHMVNVYGDNVAAFGDVVLDVSHYVQDKNIGFGKKTVIKEGVATYEDDSRTSFADLNQNYLNIEKGMYGGKYMSMPYSKSAETLAINKTVFDHVGAGKAGNDTVDRNGKPAYTAPVAAASKTKYDIPTNWKDMIATARKMKADFPELFANQKDGDGYFVAIPFCWDSGENMFISLMENLGIAYTDGTASKPADQIKFNSADAKKAMVQLKKWNNEGLICTQNQLRITDQTKGYHAYSSDEVKAGKIFMAMSSTAGARYFAEDGGFQAQLNQPLATDSNVNDFVNEDKKCNVTSVKKVISQGPSVCFFKKADASEQRATWEFYKYLTNTDNSAALAKNTAYFPLRASAYEKEEIKNLTDAGNKPVNATDNYGTKNAAYTGQALNLNKTYTDGGKYFLSDVFEYSSAARTAVGNMVKVILDDKTATTDEQITTLVNDAFASAYESILK